MYKIGIVIPSYNQGIYLERALLSILKQRCVRLSIVIMDGGSTDNSLDIIRKYQEKLLYVRSHKDTGQAAAINEGMEHLVHCDYVCWLNSDDIFLGEDTLYKAADFLEKHKQFPALYGKAKIIDGNDAYIKDYQTYVFSRKQLAKECFICQPASMIRRCAWDLAGGLNPKLFMCMDYDLWWRLSEQGDLVYLPIYLAASREHEYSKTSQYQIENFLEVFKVLKTYRGYVPFSWIRNKKKFYK